MCLDFEVLLFFEFLIYDSIVMTSSKSLFDELLESMLIIDGLPGCRDYLLCTEGLGQFREPNSPRTTPVVDKLEGLVLGSCLWGLN